MPFAFNEVAYHWRWWSVSPTEAGIDGESLRLPTPLVSTQLIKQRITCMQGILMQRVIIIQQR